MYPEESIAELESKVKWMESSLGNFFASLALLSLVPPEEFQTSVVLLAGEAHNELRGMDVTDWGAA